MGTSRLKIFMVLLITGIVWLAVGIGILLFTGVLSLPSSPTSQPLQGQGDIPIKPTTAGVVSANINYTLSGTVSKITPLNKATYLIILSEFPNQELVLDRNAPATVQDTPSTSTLRSKRVFELEPQDKATFSAFYNLKTNQWNAPVYSEVRKINISLPPGISPTATSIKQ